MINVKTLTVFHLLPTANNVSLKSLLNTPIPKPKHLYCTVCEHLDILYTAVVGSGQVAARAISTLSEERGKKKRSEIQFLATFLLEN